MKRKIEKIKEKISSIKLSLFKGAYKENLGKFKSNFKGNGLQFKEHRSYVYGDDIRDLNWSLLAKNGNPYVKIYEEERNVNLIVLVDISQSMLYGLNNVSKLEACVELICLLYLLVNETNDWISVYFVGGKLDSIKKSRGEEGFFNFLMRLKDHGLLKENGEVNLSYSYKLKKEEVKKQELFLESLKSKKDVIFFSDFHLWTQKGFAEYFFSNYWRLFKISSPIDEGIKDSVSLFLNTDISDGNKNIASINKENNRKKMKYFKSLNVRDDYLNAFLRELS